MMPAIRLLLPFRHGPRLAARCCVTAILILAGAMSSRASEPSSPCPPSGAASANVLGIDERAEITLADGRRIKVAGIEIPPPWRSAKLARAARDALAQWLVGHGIAVRPVQPKTDRWGRVVADVFARPAPPADARDPISAAEVLVDAGLARVSPSGGETTACIAALFSAESNARRDALGLWADPYYAVIEAADSAHLADRTGTFVVVEGEVVRIGQSRGRTFLNFGKSRESFTVTVSRRNKDAVEASGLALTALRGARLRVRGVLDTRFGPRIEVADPHSIERL